MTYSELAWKDGKRTPEFTVSVTYHDTGGYQGCLPKPVMDRLGCPSRITDRIVRGRRGDGR